MATKTKEDKDLESFLGRVDEIDSIIKGLASSDEGVSKQSAERADEYLSKTNSNSEKICLEDVDPDIPDLKTVVNRTVINADAFKDEPSGPRMPTYGENGTDTASFMAAIERDCQERNERKRQKKMEAEKLKDKGNIEFSKGNYEDAIKLYKQATEKIKDWDILHTNLAQAHIRLGQYEAALGACEWAFRVDENCFKAFILQGNAYLGLKNYDKAISSYEGALKVAPEKEKIVKTYIQQVKSTRESDEEERSATKLFNDGDSTAAGLVDTLTKLNRQEQPMMFYIGGLHVIKNLLNDVNSKTLFRINGGLNLSQTHPIMSKCFSALSNKPSKQDAEVCVTYLGVLQAACKDNDANRVEILKTDHLHKQLMKIVESHASNRKDVQSVIRVTVQLLHIISETEGGRLGILTNYDILRLTSCLCSMLTSLTPLWRSITGILNNFSLEKKFRIQISSSADETLIPSLEILMNGTEPGAVLISILILTNLTIETYLRQNLASRTSTWKACLRILTQYSQTRNDRQSQEIVASVLGVMVNLSLEHLNADFQEIGLELCFQCSKMLADKYHVDVGESSIPHRIFLLLSRLLIAGGDAFISRCQDPLVTEILEALKNDSMPDASAKRSAAACLVACTRTNQEARRQIVDYPKGLKAVLDLLKSSDESVVGNVALCLSHCTELPKVCKALAKTNVIMDLLVLARDQNKPTVQHNCAILIGKLCQSDHRHLERLRELHGLEILTTVLKHVKD